MVVLMLVVVCHGKLKHFINFLIEGYTVNSPLKAPTHLQRCPILFHVFFIFIFDLILATNGPIFILQTGLQIKKAFERRLEFGAPALSICCIFVQVALLRGYYRNWKEVWKLLKMKNQHILVSIRLHVSWKLENLKIPRAMVTKSQNLPMIRPSDS